MTMMTETDLAMPETNLGGSFTLRGGSLALNRVLLKNISIVGLHWSAYPEREPERIDECFEGLFEMARAGTIEPLVSSRYPLEEAGEALLALGSRRTVGKVVLIP